VQPGLMTVQPTVGFQVLSVQAIPVVLAILGFSPPFSD
jgi:hypothetical protein